MAVSLANVTAKLGFLSICILIGVIPTGFSLKFSLQTGLPEEDSNHVQESIKTTLSKTSRDLIKITKEAEISKEEMISKKLLKLFGQIDDKKNVLDELTAKFKRILILRTKIHSKKLTKMLDGLPPKNHLGSG